MSIRTQLLTAMLLAGAAVAQSAPASQTVQNQPKNQQPSKVQNGINAVKGALKNPFTPKTKAAAPASQTPVKPQAVAPQAKTAPSAKTTAPVQAKAAPKAKSAAPVHAKVTKKPAPVKPAEPAPAVAQSTPAKLPNPGKRDPFLSLLAPKGPAATCSTGKRCLAVDQIVLRGIVLTKTGNIAMVENESKRSYYLHENDALFDGAVLKITGDSVTFRQESSDVLGRPVSKEVVKKVSAPAV